MELDALIETVVGIGGDTDTNASITGQIAGSWLGWRRIPRSLVRRLPELTSLLVTARKLAMATNAEPGRPLGSASSPS